MAEHWVMDMKDILRPLTRKQLQTLSKSELITLVEGEQSIRQQHEAHIDELKDKITRIEDKYVVIKSKIFCRSSEKTPKPKKDRKSKQRKAPQNRNLLPSERYPNVDILEKVVNLQEIPICNCCNEEMIASDMFETTEYLTVIPKRFFVVRQKRRKYKCSKCHADIQTAPALPRIKSGGSYSDEMTIDVSVSKYCDLIPIDRYVAMAGRGGPDNIPAQSLIELTHYLADFAKKVYEKLLAEIRRSEILHADETPHKMLEGSDKSNWSMWGFSTNQTSYYEIHDTRSGRVATDIIKDSKCLYLISDVFSGYNKAVSDSNIFRIKNNLPLLQNVYCNAHARRKFKESEKQFVDESIFFLKCYAKIYKLEKFYKNGDSNMSFDQIRSWQKIYFRVLKRKALQLQNNYPPKSSIGKAMSYLLKNYNEFTIFLDHRNISIDNNSQERLLRNPVVGRKTWLGTHSKRGARTAAILFSIIESCKLNNVNPRQYFKDLIQDIHQKKEVYTPSGYVSLIKDSG